MVSYRPGGALATRPLHFIWVCDCSGSMSINGKIQSLNNAVREAIPHMVIAADENPYVDVWMRALKFSHSASWHIADPVRIQDFRWVDLKADPLAQPKTEIIFLLDTSGSMNNEISAVKTSCLNFAQKIIDSGVDVRLGLVGFAIGRFHGKKTSDFSVHHLSRYTIGTWSLDAPQNFQRKSQALKLRMFGGTGCFLTNKDTVDIFPYVIKLFTASGENKYHRILVIISDEVGDESGLTQISTLLVKNDIKTYVMGVSSPGKLSPHELLASSTNGKFWDIKKNKGAQDFSELLSVVADEIAQEITKTTVDGHVSSGTDLGKALEMLARVMNIPPMPDRALPPVIILISDGHPTDDFKSGLREFFRQPWGLKSIRLAIGVGKDSDHTALREFIGNSEIPILQANDPDALVNYIRWASTTAINAVSKFSVPPISPGNVASSNNGIFQTFINMLNNVTKNTQAGDSSATHKESVW